jgi:hypothetical protein
LDIDLGHHRVQTQEPTPMSNTPSPAERGRFSSQRKAATVAEFVEALREFRRRYNEQWLIQRHGYRAPGQVRRERAAGTRAVA